MRNGQAGGEGNGVVVGIFLWFDDDDDDDRPI